MRKNLCQHILNDVKPGKVALSHCPTTIYPLPTTIWWQKSSCTDRANYEFNLLSEMTPWIGHVRPSVRPHAFFSSRLFYHVIDLKYCSAIQPDHSNSVSDFEIQNSQFLLCILLWGHAFRFLTQNSRLPIHLLLFWGCAVVRAPDCISHTLCISYTL